MRHRNFIKPTDSTFIRVFKIIGIAIVGAAGAALFAFLFGYFVMLLWNWLMPMLFELPEINFWMAVGIIILARLIFGSFHGHRHDRTPRDERSKRIRDKMKNKFSHFDKWAHYDGYWEEEGKQAFEEYVKRKSENGSNEPGKNE